MAWGHYLVISILFTTPLYATRWNKEKNRYHLDSLCATAQQIKEAPYRFVQCAATLVEEAIRLNLNLISMDTIKVITAFTPFFLATRMADESIHSNFYDKKSHKNNNQMNQNFITAINKGCDLGIISLSSLAILAWNDQLRLTARIFAIGALSALYAKDFVKKLHIKACLRPWNEHFNAEKQSYGGFPSGHMIEASYMLTVWGLQYGLKAAIPLGIFAGLSFGVLVSSNRHYASQAVAGAGFGVAFGLAAHRLITTKISETMQCNFRINEQKEPTFCVAYNF